MLPLIIGAVELIEASPAIAGLAAEALPAVEAAAASAEAAITGSSAATAVATSTAAAGTEAAAGTATEAAAEAAAGRAATSAGTPTAEHIAEYLKTPEGNKLLMDGVKAHMERLTTDASEKTGFMEKMTHWVGEKASELDPNKLLKTAAIGGVATKVAGVAVSLGAVGIMGGLMEHMQSSASQDAHASLHGASTIGGHTDEAIQKLAETGAHYGVATCLNQDMKHVITQVSADNVALEGSVKDLVVGLQAVSVVPGMEGSQPQIEALTAKTEPLKDLSHLETVMSTGSGKLTPEQLHDAHESMQQASLILDGTPAQAKVNTAQENLQKLGPASDLKTTQAALTSVNEARRAIQQDIYNDGEQLVNRLKQIAADRSDDLQHAVNELKPQIAVANAQNLDKHLAQAREKECAPAQQAASHPQPELSR